MVLFISIFVLAAIIAVFAFDLGWNNAVVKERNDLVFEGKNQAYGAFMIRRDYSKVLLISLACALGFAVLTVIPVFLIPSTEDVKIDKDVAVVMTPPPPTNPDQPRGGGYRKGSGNTATTAEGFVRHQSGRKNHRGSG
jgi:hypothetical protein